MNETMNIPKQPSSLQMQGSSAAGNRAPSKQPEGRVLQILADTKALDQWRSNLEKLRLKDTP